MRIRLAPALVLLSLTVACAAGAPPEVVAPPPAAAPTPAAAAPQPAVEPAPEPLPDDLLDATLWMQRAIESRLLTRAIYRNAAEKLDAAIADPDWNALAEEDREETKGDLPPAVILDVDEAALDNSPYEARLIRSGEEYDEFTWAEWCKERKAKPVAGAVEFAQAAAEKGVAIFYISNRAQDLDEATLDNLRAVGFPVADDDAFLGLGVVVPGCEQFGSEKGCRRKLVARTHRVLMQVGDQIGDFVDVVANTNEGRAEAMAPYLDWIGERWWPLPNPMYGSWVPAQFNNYWAQPREERRRAVIDALLTD